jgi:uncharacterized membrane protein
VKEFLFIAGAMIAAGALYAATRPACNPSYVAVMTPYSGWHCLAGER